MELRLGVRMAVEAGEGTGRACTGIAGAQKHEEGEGMDVIALDM